MHQPSSSMTRANRHGTTCAATPTSSIMTPPALQTRSQPISYMPAPAKRTRSVRYAELPSVVQNSFGKSSSSQPVHHENSDHEDPELEVDHEEAPSESISVTDSPSSVAEAYAECAVTNRGKRKLGIDKCDVHDILRNIASACGSCGKESEHLFQIPIAEIARCRQAYLSLKCAEKESFVLRNLQQFQVNCTGTSALLYFHVYLGRQINMCRDSWSFLYGFSHHKIDGTLNRAELDGLGNIIVGPPQVHGNVGNRYAAKDKNISKVDCLLCIKLESDGDFVANSDCFFFFFFRVFVFVCVCGMWCVFVWMCSVGICWLIFKINTFVDMKLNRLLAGFTSIRSVPAAIPQ